jgi:hypothetical protein
MWLLFALAAACNAALLISKAYLTAMSCGVLEYLAESALLPSLTCCRSPTFLLPATQLC